MENSKFFKATKTIDIAVQVHDIEYSIPKSVWDKLSKQIENLGVRGNCFDYLFTVVASLWPTALSWLLQLLVERGPLWITLALLLLILLLSALIPTFFFLSSGAKTALVTRVEQLKEDFAYWRNRVSPVADFATQPGPMTAEGEVAPSLERAEAPDASLRPSDEE